MSAITVIIVDDEPKARNVLRQLLVMDEVAVNIVAECSNLLEAVEKIKEYQPTVVFLDIRMSRYAGYEIVKFFDKIEFEIIFVTAYDQYAIKAFEINAMDYLVKPIERSRLSQALQKLKHKVEHQLALERKTIEYNYLLESIEKKKSTKLIIPEVGNRKIVELSEIIAIEANGSYTKFHMANEDNFVTSKNLKFFEGQLSEDDFFRVHRTYIVNLNHIKSINKNTSTLTAKQGLEIKIARGRIEEFLEKITN